MRGVNATVDPYDQPRGSVPRISNLYSTIRGLLQSIAGSRMIVDFGTRISQGVDWLFYKFQTATQGFYFALLNHFDHHITQPLPVIMLTGVNVGGGALIPGNQYYYQITATSFGAPYFGTVQGQTLPAAEVSLVLPGGMNAIRIDWTGQQDAAGYVIYGTVTGALKLALFPAAVIPNVPGATLSFTDIVGAPSAGTNPGLPVVDTSQVCEVYKSGTGVIAKFPYAPFLPLSADVINPLSMASPAGGVVGNVSPLSRFLPFVNKLLLILGNGYPIYIFDGSTFTKIANTFTAQYPTWQGTVAWVVGDYVIPTAPNGHYYKCVQAGTNGGVEPVWPTTSQQRVVDGQVIWEESGLVSTSPYPPGCAFATIYAGSLWVWNTYPTNTPDGLDGPSALRMSDVNNPNSWNPINAAFIDKDDSTQGMGMATFTIAETGIPPIGSLILFKNYSTTQIVGVFGSHDFAIHRVQTDMGCIAPKTILFVPGFGIMRLTHMGFAIFDGVRDRLVSEEVRPYIFQVLSDITALPFDTAYLGTSTLASNPPLYICTAKFDVVQGQGSGATRVFIYDLVLRAWTIVDVPLNSDALGDIGTQTYMGILKQVRNIVSTPTVTGFLSYEGGKLYRWFAGDTKWYQVLNGTGGSDVQWAFTTPLVYAQTPDTRLYLRKVVIKGTNTTGNPLTFKLSLQGESTVTYIGPQTINLGFGQFTVEIPIGEVALNASAIISGTGVVDIESVTWYVDDRPSGVPARLT